MIFKTRSKQPKSTKSLPKNALNSKGVELLFLGIALVGNLHLLIMLGIEIKRYIHTYNDIIILNKKLIQGQEELAELLATKAHEYDDRYREQLARAQGFIYPDEKRFVTVFDKQADNLQNR